MGTPLVVERVPVGSLTPDGGNVRTHGERNLEAIRASLRQFGQRKPIVVDADGVVRAGNGLLAAAVSLGWPEIDVVRTELRGSAAIAYAVADNRTAELSAWDIPGLASTLEALRDEGFDPAAVGFTEAEARSLVEAAEEQAHEASRSFGLGDAAESNPKLAAFLEARRRGRIRFRDKDETNYWVCLVFQGYQQKREFLESARVRGVPVLYGMYCDGQTLAASVGVEVRPNVMPPIESPLNNRLAQMALALSGDGAMPADG